MQIDMHYYGTFALARAAGIERESARIIAYASQFVDDNVADSVEDHDDGSQLYAVPTAHHPGDLRNRESDDQRFIWVPFHFLPGGKGKTFTEKLICCKNSDISKQMVANHVAQSHQPYARELLGLTAHVYADTFAHWGFSGVSSRRNKVNGDSFILTQDDAVVEAALGKSFGEWISQYGGFIKNIRARISGVSEIYSGSLGHGAVSNYPDLPFLQYQFSYEHTGKVVYHDNPANYLEAAENLYNMFKQFADENEKYRGSVSVPWKGIQNRIQWIFSQTGNKWDRADIWKASVMDGAFGVSEYIPEYTADRWNNQCKEFQNMNEGSEALNLPVHHFFRAASYHVHYVLRELLPSHGIMVV